MGYTRSRGRFFQLCISGRTRSVMLLMVSADIRLPNCSSRMSLISLVLLPMAYRPMILSASESARIFSRLRTTWGSKVPSRSRGVFMVTSPIEVCTCLLMWPLRRLPHSRSPLSRWLSISPSRALLSRFSNSGANTPSLPERGTPAFNCSMAFALNCS